MDTEEYLIQILKGQELDEEQVKALIAARDEIEELLRAAFKDCNPIIRYGGSRIKGTMNKISFDLDIICYFPHDDTSAGETLEEIYNNVKNFLAESYLVEEKKSALRIKSKASDTYGVDFHVDVVPGRFVDESKTDAFLYQSNGDKKRLKTNLDTHIEHIKDSGLAKVIRLAKVWNEKFGLGVKTFVLELLVVKYAQKTEKEPLTNGIKSFWESLKRSDLSIEDPANPDGNDLSPIFDDTTKQLLTDYGERALENIESNDWKGIFGEPEITKEEKIAAIQTLVSSQPNAPRPWAYNDEENMVSSKS